MSDDAMIPVDDEGFALEARLDGPEDGSGVVLCHPHPAFGGTLDTPIVAAIAEALAAAGMRVLRFNFRGIGASGGTPEGGLVEERDVKAACGWLRPRCAHAPTIALCGYSFGALMAAKAIAVGEEVRAFAGIGFPTTIISQHPERIAQVRSAVAAVPTLLVSGDEDQFCRLEDLHHFCDGAKDARVVELPGVNHFPSGVDLTAVLRITVDFLRGTSAPPN